MRPAFAAPGCRPPGCSPSSPSWPHAAAAARLQPQSIGLPGTGKARTAACHQQDRDGAGMRPLGAG